MAAFSHQYFRWLRTTPLSLRRIGQKDVRRIFVLTATIVLCFLAFLSKRRYPFLGNQDGFLLNLQFQGGSISSARNSADSFKSDWLKSENVTFVLHKDKNMSFFFPEDNFERGIDAIREYIVVNEENISSLFHFILSQRIPKMPETSSQAFNSFLDMSRHGLYSRKRQVVMDIGSNRGYYSFLSAAYGYEVYAFDPQPHCAFFVKGGVLLNGFSDLVHFRHAYVSSDVSGRLQIQKRTGCCGKFPNDVEDGFGDILKDRLDDLPGQTDLVSVAGVRLDDIFTGLDAEVLLMKIDVEGHEHKVLRSGRKLLRSGSVRNIIMEVNLPMMARQNEGLNKTAKETKKVIRWLIRDLGYKSRISEKGPFLQQKDVTLKEWNRYLDPSINKIRTEMNAWFYKEG